MSSDQCKFNEDEQQLVPHFFEFGGNNSNESARSLKSTGSPAPWLKMSMAWEIKWVFGCKFQYFTFILFGKMGLYLVNPTLTRYLVFM